MGEWGAAAKLPYLCRVPKRQQGWMLREVALAFVPCESAEGRKLWMSWGGSIQIGLSHRQGDPAWDCPCPVTLAGTARGCDIPVLGRAWRPAPCRAGQRMDMHPGHCRPCALDKTGALENVSHGEKSKLRWRERKAIVYSIIILRAEEMEG